MVTDRISDFIIRLKNGSEANAPVVKVVSSKLIESIAHALKKAGYVGTVEKSAKKDNTIEIGLLSTESGQRISGVERVSRPSRRIYQKYNDIRIFRSGFGNVFLSTPKGIMMDTEAKKLKVGGEVLFKIW